MGPIDHRNRVILHSLPLHHLYIMAEARAARLAAVEARLAGTNTAPTKNVEKKEEPVFEPTEKGDVEKKKEFTKLLFRGVVRDNGYKEAMGCVDVSPSFQSDELWFQEGIEVVAEIAVSVKVSIPSAGMHACHSRDHLVQAWKAQAGRVVSLAETGCLDS